MDDPVMVETLRGGRVESAHRGVVAVLDADGGVVFAAGDIERAIFPRSAVKSIQALPLLESGAADRLGLTDAEIALACASHSGEERHVLGAAAMLAKAGRGVEALECGVHWPLGEAASRELAQSGKNPSALHNNCSGKHAGFICLACEMGVEPRGYVRAEHPMMREVTQAMAEMTGTRLDPADAAVDGCSIPTYAVPLRALAHAFARFGVGEGMGARRRAATQRIRRAVAAHPEMVAGTGRGDTVLMSALGDRAFTKTGAEGVWCAALPELGVGIALKCDDGTTRASSVMIAALLRRLLRLEGAQAEAVRRVAEPVLTNWNGIAVGALRPAGPIA
jgi:L-asparaginase II